ncbi:primosomal protein N' [Thermus oshimai]|uniref:Probable replication restart protein PriA n=2 Tax=Thermus oshimai TaxID=56957 RepID=K7RKQ4_THEOS|nr:primosomal protein N' (replication factor Y) - superfamily II helicase [Thermus oshimai JL-2]
MAGLGGFVKGGGFGYLGPMRLLEVALPLPLEALTYLPPLGREEEEALGRRVAVPWRGEVRVGVVVGEGEGRPALHLRHALAYLDERPLLREEEIAFLKAAAHHLFAPLGQVLADFLPPMPELVHRVRLFPRADPGLLPPGLSALRDWQEAKGFDPKLLDLLREAGVLEEEVSFRPQKRVLRLLKEPEEGLEEAPRRVLEALKALGEAESQAALARAAGVGVGVVKRLLEKGYIGLLPPEPPRGRGPALEPLFLPERPERVNGGRLRERMRVLKGLLEEGDHLVLFPEVGLLERFLEGFPEARPYHGGLPSWAREALFQRPGGTVFATYGGLLLPYTPQGIVVVEEGSESYKLPSGTRAFIPPLAELRARLLGIPLTYLSLVPAVEVLERKPLRLPVPKPRLLTLSLKEERGWPFTGRALALLKQVEERGRQAVVLASRRGFSALLLCPDCGYKPTCPDCALPLRFHQSPPTLLCHQCGHKEAPPPLCPRCGSPLLEPRGPGVDWLVRELKERLTLPVYRFAKDGKDDLTPLLRGEPGVVVGTTALLRGPVLPGLALVLLPYADGFLMDSDFRAAERYHRLLWALTELRPGHRPLLVLQTFHPDHPVHRALEEGEVEAFLWEEKALREALDYPPKVRMVKLEVAHRKEERALALALELLEALRKAAGEEEVLGPAPAPVPKLKGHYLYHLLLKGSTERLHELLAHLDRRKFKLDPDPFRFVGLLED